MEYVNLGKSKLLVSRTAFGALPIQRVSDRAEATAIIRAAYDGGINFFDTARAYSDSEEKLGNALEGLRKNVVIATKTASKTAEGVLSDLHQSLQNLKTDYIDLYQLHNPSFVPKPGESEGIYEVLQKAKREGKIRSIGITNHSRMLALDAVLSGLYDTIQYPFSMLAAKEEIDLVAFCEQTDTGFIAMKALCGGLLTNIPLAFGFIRQYANAVPIWGVQKIEEVRQLLYLESHPPLVDEQFMREVEESRAELSGDFCRGCGYCKPCPAGIPIENANRMMQLLRRSPKSNWLTPEWKAQMEKINNCTHCNQCAERCPYRLKPYETLPAHLADYLSQYEAFMA